MARQVLLLATIRSRGGGGSEDDERVKMHFSIGASLLGSRLLNAPSACHPQNCLRK